MGLVLRGDALGKDRPVLPHQRGGRLVTRRFNPENDLHGDFPLK